MQESLSNYLREWYSKVWYDILMVRLKGRSFIPIIFANHRLKLQFWDYVTELLFKFSFQNRQSNEINSQLKKGIRCTYIFPSLILTPSTIHYLTCENVTLSHLLSVVHIP